MKDILDFIDEFDFKTEENISKFRKICEELINHKIKIVGYEDIDVTNIEKITDGKFDDVLRMYLDEITNMPRLTAQQEMALGKIIKNHPKESQPALQAQKDLFTANLKFVVSIAKICAKNYHFYIGRDMSLIDLIQEGNLGLLEAVERFDYRKGKRGLKPYAWWWIFAVITQSIDKTDIYPLKELKKLKRVQEKLFQKYEREPTPEEVAKEMETTVDRVSGIMKILQEPVSLEMLMEEDSPLENIEDIESPTPFDIATEHILSETLKEVLDTLTDREKQVLTLCFGLKDGKVRTLEEVGKYFKLTGERIRQIEAKALRKLRHPSRSKKLKDFLY